MSSLEDMLHGAIGAQTQLFVAKVVDVELTKSTQRVSCYSEQLGNFDVVVGNHLWLNANDWIFVLRTASESKYNPYMFVGYAGTTGAALVGTPLIWNRSGTVDSSTQLPTREKGARIGEIRQVGASTFWIYTPEGIWEPFGGAGSVSRSFGWYIEGPISSPADDVGPRFTMDVSSRCKGIAGDIKALTSGKRYATDIQFLKTGESTWQTIFDSSGLPGEAKGPWVTTTGNIGTNWVFKPNPAIAPDKPSDGYLVIQAGWKVRLCIGKVNDGDPENSVDVRGLTLQLHLEIV